MDLSAGILPTWMKQTLAIGSLLLTLMGIPAIFGFVCITLMLVISEESAAIATGLISFTLIMLTVGAGGVTFWHSTRSLQEKVSHPLRLPSVWILLTIFGFLIIVGLMITENESISGILLPPILFGITLLPPLIALSWFINNRIPTITYRQGFVALAGGLTVSMLLTFFVISLIIVVVLALVNNFANSLFDQLDNVDVSDLSSLTILLDGWNFIYIFILITLIIPIVSELCKPLVTLPILGRLSTQGAFLVGSAAGAGYAMMGNLAIAGWGLTAWNGALMVLVLGGAINPFCSGLVATGWHKVLQKSINAWTDWTIRFFIAITIHAFWNSGALLLFTLGKAEYFGIQPWNITPVGILAAGSMLALVIILGLSIYRMGRTTMENLSIAQAAGLQVTRLERTIAIWALVCLAFTVPTGLIWLHFLNK